MSEHPAKCVVLLFREELEAWRAYCWISSSFADFNTKLTLKNQRPISILPSLSQLHWQSIPSSLFHPQTLHRMIRIALRQSTRTVGAVSVLSRLALVSYKRTLTLVLPTRLGVTPAIEV